jgi:hypothetical protein
VEQHSWREVLQEKYFSSLCMVCTFKGYNSFENIPLRSFTGFCVGYFWIKKSHYQNLSVGPNPELFTYV